MSGRARRTLMMRSVERLVSTSRLYTRPTHGVEVATSFPYAVRRPHGDDLIRIADDLRGLVPPTKIALIRRRHVNPAFAVFLAVDEAQRICGFAHVEHDRVRDEHLGLDLGPLPGVIHLFDDFVAPSHRGQRLHAALTAARLVHAHDRGAPLASILVADSNHASRLSVTRSGFATAFRVVTLHGPTGRRSWPLTRRPAAHLTGHEADRSWRRR